jgi:hypothetical protein
MPSGRLSPERESEIVYRSIRGSRASPGDRLRITMRLWRGLCWDLAYYLQRRRRERPQILQGAWWKLAGTFGRVAGSSVG